jgi:acetolactate synthase I/II/III large subunit
MQIVGSLTQKLMGIATVHEMANGIVGGCFTVATESRETALALVTSGLGFTNIVTAVAYAWYESRELLVIDGQAEPTDLSRGAVRQRGIWEACGAEIVRPITRTSTTLMKPIGRADFAGMIKPGSTGRKGNVFIEIPLDIQASQYQGGARSPGDSVREASERPVPLHSDSDHALREMLDCLRQAKRLVILLDGIVDRNAAYAMADRFAEARIPPLRLISVAPTELTRETQRILDLSPRGELATFNR